MSALHVDSTGTPRVGTPVSWPYAMENSNVAWASGGARGDRNAAEDTTAAVGGSLAKRMERFGTGEAVGMAEMVILGSTWRCLEQELERRRNVIMMMRIFATRYVG